MTQPIYSGAPLFTGPMLSLETVIATLSADIVAVRSGRGLPALRGAPAGYPGGSILVGQEWLKREHSAPRIVMVPTGIRLLPARPLGLQQSLAVSQEPVRPFTVGSSASMSTSGGMRIPRPSTRSTHSRARLSSFASSSARATASSAALRASSTAKRGGTSRPTIGAAGACSSTPSHSHATSPTSRGSFCRTAPNRRAACRSTPPSRSRSPMARPPKSGRSSLPREVH